MVETEAFKLKFRPLKITLVLIISLLVLFPSNWLTMKPNISIAPPERFYSSDSYARKCWRPEDLYGILRIAFDQDSVKNQQTEVK